MTDRPTSQPPAVTSVEGAGQVYDSELRFRALVTATSTTIYRMSPDWQEMRQLAGQGFLADTTQPSVRWLDTYIALEDRPTVLAAINAAIAGRSMFELEHRVRLADGSLGWTLSRAVPIFAADGSILEWFGAAVDVTHKHELDARLRESEAAFKTIADAVPQLIWVVDADGAVVFFNQPCRTFFGAGQVWDHVSRFAATRIHPDDREATRQAFQRAQASGQRFETEHRLQDLGGHYRWFITRATPYRDPESGAIVRWYGSSFDVHDRRRSEDRLRSLNEDLEVQVETGSRNLLAAEAQVRQMQKLEAIGQLTGGLAHDFNNLLTVIRNAAELLRRQPPPERQQACIDAIIDTTDRAARLTHQLLAFARRQALQPQVFAAGQRVRQITDMLRSMVGEGVHIHVDAPPQDCHVLADPSQFETALVNLVVNARDAMHGQGSIRVVVSTAEAANEAVVKIAVADQGHGIAAEDLERIFEPFYTTKGVGRGTGLGLSQVHGFVHQSGGTLAVDSALGRGTTFTVQLPQAEPLPPAPSHSRRGTGRTSGCVLVVDDNASVREMTVDLLHANGYQTCQAGDATTALTLLQEQHARIDWVLADIVMPGLSGVDLTQVISERWPAIALVLTSGYSQALNLHRHNLQVLRKPYSLEELLKALAATVSR